MNSASKRRSRIIGTRWKLSTPESFWACATGAPKAVLSGGLLDMAQAAASLGIGVRTLREHLRAGNIRYVDVGRGKERRSPRFAPHDLTEFQEQHRGQSWPSTKEAKSFISSSSSKVIDFAALRAARSKREAQEFERKSGKKRRSAPTS